MGEGCRDIRVECMQEFEKIHGEQKAMNLEIGYIKDHVAETKQDVKEIKNCIVNNKVNSAKTKLKVDAWVVFIRISLIAIMGALATKLIGWW